MKELHNAHEELPKLPTLPKLPKPEPHTQVEVYRLPNCDFCGAVAAYDGRTCYGPWAYMCERCFPAYGVGLGLGRGQKLVLRKEVKDETDKGT